MSRPLQNRVTPWGEIEANEARGMLMGNRGGRLHDEARKLGRRRWVSKAWISCVLSFKGRSRAVMGRGYTELFFLDEAVALSAGHRPCYECRRADALAFAEAWAEGHGLTARPRAGEMDDVLHAQRRGEPERVEAAKMPDGTIFAADGAAFLKLGDAALPWSWHGWGSATPLPRGDIEALTCASIRQSLAAGYRPRLHPSAAI